MKKGFTLVELLAVIILISAILFIVIPTVNDLIQSSKNSLSETQIINIEKAAEQYYLNEGMSDNKTCVSVDYLLENGYLDSDKIINPKDNTEITGSVKIDYKNNKYVYTYSSNRCGICKVITGDGTNIGDKLECEVKPGTKFNFYVLSKEGNSTNLIMERNICSDGTVATSSNTCLVAWASKADYADDANYGTWGNNDKGPITAMKYLNKATSSWENIDNLNIIYNDESGNFANFAITGKARLPYLSEVSDYDREEGTNAFLYNYLHIDCWDENGNEVMYCDESIDRVGVYEDGIENEFYIYGYWLLSSYNDPYPYYAYVVDYGGFVLDNAVDEYAFSGVRPVINVTNTDIYTDSPAHVCEAVDEKTVTAGNIPKGYYEPGDEYICEVKPGTKYHFFVLSEEKNKINLISSDYITTDGAIVSKATDSLLLTEWISNEDYYKDVGGTIPDELENDNAMCQYGGHCSFNDKGPITVINRLNEITRKWINIPNINEVYDDYNGQYTNFEIVGNSRLPKFIELQEYTQVGTLPKWLTNYYSSYKNYPLMDSSNGISHSETTNIAHVDLGKGMVYYEEYNTTPLYVRPVISLSKKSIK